MGFFDTPEDYKSKECMDNRFKVISTSKVGVNTIYVLVDKLTAVCYSMTYNDESKTCSNLTPLYDSLGHFITADKKSYEEEGKK